LEATVYLQSYPRGQYEVTYQNAPERVSRLRSETLLLSGDLCINPPLGSIAIVCSNSAGNPVCSKMRLSTAFFFVP